MDIITVEDIIEKLQDRRIDMVSKATGLHYNTIRALRAGESLNPSYATVKALEKYFYGNEK